MNLLTQYQVRLTSQKCKLTSRGSEDLRIFRGLTWGLKGWKEVWQFEVILDPYESRKPGSSESDSEVNPNQCNVPYFVNLYGTYLCFSLSSTTSTLSHRTLLTLTRNLFTWHIVWQVRQDDMKYQRSITQTPWHTIENFVSSHPLHLSLRCQQLLQLFLSHGCLCIFRVFKPKFCAKKSRRRKKSK